jgi:hypothetical protein
MMVISRVMIDLNYTIKALAEAGRMASAEQEAKRKKQTVIEKRLNSKGHKPKEVGDE